MASQVAKALTQFGLSSLTGEMFALLLLGALACAAVLRYVCAGLDIHPTKHYWLAVPVAFLIVILGVFSRIPAASSDPTVPDLRISLRMSGADLPRLDATFISVVATIYNAGEATNISGYPLIVTIPKAQPLVGTLQLIPLTGIQVGDELLCGEDALDRHLEPLPRGGQLEGKLLYTFKGVRADAFKQRGTMLTLVLTDESGKPWPVSAPVVPPVVHSEIRTVPGLEPPLPQNLQSRLSRSAMTRAAKSPCHVAN